MLTLKTTLAKMQAMPTINETLYGRK